MKTGFMKQIFSRILLLFFVIFYVSISAAKGGSLPMGHWSYDVIDQLISRGYFHSINDVAKPYDRVDIARELIKIDHKTVKNSFEFSLIEKLESELKNELNSLRDGVYPSSRLNVNNEITEFFWQDSQKDFLGKGQFKLKSLLNFGKHFSLQTSTIIRQKNAYDFVPRERVYSANNHYTEQAFISYHEDNITLKLGKDYLDWGYGWNSFVIDQTSGSYNQLFVQWKSKYLRYTYFTAILDQHTFIDSLTNNSLETINRYYTASRLDVSLFNHDLKLGIWQSVLYGGKDASLGLRYSNPIMIYYAVQWNDYEKGNLLVGADLSFYPLKHFNFYAGFVVDDWQIKNEGSLNELSPNKWGGSLGLKLIDILKRYSIWGTDFHIELSKVTNRTFNQKTPYQRLLYGENFIAHPLGTDFETLDISLKHWFSNHLRCAVFFSIYNKGEGNLNEHTQPWLEKDENGNYIYTLETGYHEDSPFGIVEKTYKFGLGMLYQPNHQFLTEVQVKHIWIDNYRNIKNNHLRDWEFLIKLSYEFQSTFSLL